MRVVQYVVTLSVLALASVESKNCNMDSACSCTYDDGSGTVDLSPLGSQDQSNPLIRDSFASDNYAYSYNPCYPFTEGTCVNAAACQVDTSSSIYYNIGDSSKVTFSYDGLNLIATYDSDDGARKSVVTLVCDPNADPPSSTVDGETQPTTYSFTVTSKYACPNGADPGPGPGPGPHVIVTVTASVSVGAILSIIFFSVLIVYLAAGMAFMRFRRHETGLQMVPNVSFWASIPGLVKDGCKFCVGFVTRKQMVYGHI